MSIGLLFWMLMILWLLYGFWGYPPNVPTNYRPLGGHVLLWIVIALLGWHSFGFIIHQ